MSKRYGRTQRRKAREVLAQLERKLHEAIWKANTADLRAQRGNVARC